MRPSTRIPWRNALTLAASLALAPAARAQAPDGRLLDEQQYLQQSQPYGYGQPYAGQPQYNYPPPDDDLDADDDIAPSDEDATADDGWDAEAYTDFEADLSPYGDWVDVADQGRVWVPSASAVGTDFVPYGVGGHWVLTDYGWTWVSDWDWGWAPFHYGRWFWYGGYGWCWRPGRTWGPGWVHWRHGGGYVGWAPMGPRGWRVAPPIGSRTAWRFVTMSTFGTGHPAYLPAGAARSVFTHTAPVTNFRTMNNVRFNAGPAPQAVAAATGRAFTPASVHALPQAAPRPSIIPRPAPASRAVGHPGAGPLPAWRGPANPYNGGYVAPHNNFAAPQYRSNPAYRPMPAWQAPHATAPSYAPQYRAPAYSAPQYRAPAYAAPQYRAPSYSAPSYHYSAPSYSAPRYSAPSYHYSAPSYSAPHYSAPSYHYSAPSYSAPHYSAPAFHSSSSSHSAAPSFGGFRGGCFRGGHR